MVGGAVHHLCGPKARPIIGITHIGGTGTSFCQPVPIDPFHIPALAVIVADGVAANNRTGHRIAGGIIGLALVSDFLPVVSGEQVIPTGVIVGVCNRVTSQSAAQHISSCVVGIGFRSTAVRCFHQPAKCIILVTAVKCKRIRTNRPVDFTDVTTSIVIIPVVELGINTIRRGVDKILNLVCLAVCSTGSHIVSPVLVHARNISPADPQQVVILKGEGAARTEQHTAKSTIIVVVVIGLPELVGQAAD